MSNLSLKIALPIILAGIFIIVVFVALEADKLDVGFYIVFVLVAIYIFMFGFATGQKFASPVKKILQRATDLSKGDLTSRVYLEDKDELGDLARIFNKIAEELEQSRSQTETTEQSVDIKVRAKTQALEEKINALEQKIKNRTIELDRLVSESEKLRRDTVSKEGEIDRLKKEITNLTGVS